MVALVIINAAPNLSVWQRKVERTRALSHTAEISHKNQKNSKLSSGQIHTDQSKLLSRDTSAPSLKKSKDAGHLLRVASEHERRFDPRSTCPPTFEPSTIQAKSLRPLKVINTDEEEEIYQLFVQARMEQNFSSNALFNDFGCYRGMRTDPFGIVSELAAPAIDYYAQVIVPSYSAIWKIFNVNSMVPQTLFELLDTRVCLLAMVLPPKIITDPSWYPGKRASDSFLKGYNIALSRVRNQITELSGRADASTLMAVNGLAILAGAMGDIASFKVHAQSLATLVKSAGGFENLGRFSFIKSLLLQWESQWAYNPDTRMTIFPDARAKYVAEFPSFPFSSGVEELVSKLPIGFRRLAQKQCLSLRTLEVLARCAQVSAGRVPLDMNTREQFHPEQRLFADFFEACPCIVPGAENPPPLEKFVVQALILYCVHTWSPLRFNWGLYKATRLDLTMEILARPSIEEREEDVMIWIYTNLIDSWQVTEGSGRLLPEGKRVFARLEHIYGAIKDEHVPQIIQRVKLFFWNEKFERRCERCLVMAITNEECGPT